MNSAERRKSTGTSGNPSSLKDEKESLEVRAVRD